MRLPTGEYILENISFATLTEVDLLAHYQGVEIPSRAALHRLRVSNLSIGNGEFTLGESIPWDAQTRVRQTDTSLSIHCSCRHAENFLCYHELFTWMALITVPALRHFFDTGSRRLLFQDYARRYGLEQEDNLDSYFELRYDKGNLLVSPKNDAILMVDPHKSDDMLQVLTNQVHRKTGVAESKTRVLVLCRHRFYDHLRFELLDVALSASGKPKGTFDLVDPKQLLWKAKDAQEAKFYAALASFEQHYNETEDESTFHALQIVASNPLKFPFYYHDRDISEKLSSKSIRPIHVKQLDTSMELFVFKKEPFYEVSAYLIWEEKRIPVKEMVVTHGYFLQRQADLFLVPSFSTLTLIHYFKKQPALLLVHQSKYDDFLARTLAPMEHLLKINYAYIRKATKEEIAIQQADSERIIYFSQEGSYVHITPVMRYGNIEIPISSHKQIRAQDANGNLYELDRHWTDEDTFKKMVSIQHEDFGEQEQERDFFYLHQQQFLEDDWFLTAFEAWKNEGITLLGFQELGLTKLNPNRAKIDIKVLSGTDWFNSKLEVSYGELKASIKQVHRAIRHKSKYVQLDDGTYGILPEEWFNKIARFFQLAVLDDTTLKIPQIALSEVETLFAEHAVQTGLRQGMDSYRAQTALLRCPAKVVVPATLQTTLHPYQQDGLQWMNQLASMHLGGCLADDMGLGKTIQVIAFLLLQHGDKLPKQSVVIAPTSLLFNWQAEFKKLAPSLRVLCLHGSQRELDDVHLSRYDVLLISYGTLVADIGKLRKRAFQAAILDESQAIKNPTSARYKAACLLQAQTRFAVTGTPLENSTYDIYGQLSFACPGLLGSNTYFKDTFAGPIDRFGDRKRAVILQQTIAPFLLRRTKKQVAKELPEKTEITIYCEMGDVQREIYDNYEGELRDYLEGVRDDEVSQINMHVLAGLTRLRQICNAPALLKEGYANSISAKMEVLMEQLSQLTGDHKVLVFSQFVDMLDLIREELDKRVIPYSYLTGQTKHRGELVKEFQEDKKKRIFLISMKAGSVGLNLTAADYVFLIDPWWNPAIETQAIDRSHRLGQDKPVIAVRLICPNTVEDKIMKLQDKKRDLAVDLVKTDVDFATKFSKKEWLDLLQ
ncbi:DEAD/DEAH box helicase [Sphingobacterium paludis]|uniref:SNF2 family DNA or RNA helicase n=1 Tax=Sphingobacterium paludis TaxID=1476465 RepID=A0A4R7CSA9_9SPHI|nr:DEAD/DEAH box helicase [Sphingobacterium paludis]TDS07517.1 SNF2 family DNA or RNA helicase [Sphingobacterium paludis]